jgi:Tfp pilus assembly protein PilN
MLRINLLAEEAKQTIRFQRLYFFIVKAELALLALVLLAAIATLAAEKIFSFNLYQPNQETVKLINSSSANDSAKVKEINDKMATVADIENSHVFYAKILRNLSILMPDDVSLSYIGIDSEQGVMDIRGLAPTRANLLDLEKNLQNAAWLSNVNVPLEEKLNKTNINFDITINFDQKKIPS